MKRVGLRKGIDNIVWTYSRYKATDCMMKYWLLYVKTPRPKIPMTPQILLGKLLHERIETFYQLKGKHVGEPKKKTAEEFAQATVGLWNYRTLMISQKDPDAVRWSFPFEHATWRPVIRELCEQLYAEYAQSPPPMLSEWRSPLVTIHDDDPFTPGLRLFAILDEIRHPLTIRDHKSRGTRISDIELAKDEQFTLYSGILSLTCAHDAEFAKRIGATEYDVQELRLDPLALMPKIKLEHHYLPTWRRTAKNPYEGVERGVEIITTPPRSREAFLDVIDRIADAEERIKSSPFEEDIGKHCSWCLARKPCDDRYEQTKQSAVPNRYQQPLFGMTKPAFNPDIDASVDYRTPLPVLKRRRLGQKRFSFMKPPEDVVLEARQA